MAMASVPPCCCCFLQLSSLADNHRPLPNGKQQISLRFDIEESWNRESVQQPEPPKNASQKVKAARHSAWGPNSASGNGVDVLNQRLESNSIDELLSILQWCRRNRSLSVARKLYVHICDEGSEANRHFGNYITPMFIECGSISDAECLFRKLDNPNEHSWTSMIIGYVQCGYFQDALDLYGKMHNFSVFPTSHTIASVLKACARLRSIEKGREVHAEIARLGLDSDTEIGNILVGMYARCGFLEQAEEVFDRLLVQSVVSWTGLISGYAEYGPLEKALEYFEHMNLASVPPNAFTFSCILKACGCILLIEKGREIHADVVAKGLETNHFIANSLVSMYAKCGSMFDARETSNRLSHRDVVTWTALIAGYADYGPTEEALKCYDEMQLECISPNSVSIICALKACGSLRAVEKGKEIHMSVKENELRSNLSLGNSLISMYSQCGLISEAHEVFQSLSSRDEVSWTALISGYADGGHSEEALDCFEKMETENLSPNVITFCCALKACNNAELLDRGRDIHSQIVQRALDREVSIGNALVGLYAKSGSFIEAEDIFGHLPVYDVVSWNALIAGYVEHGFSHEALKCFDQMQSEKLTPDVVTITSCLKACGNIGAIEKGHRIHTAIPAELIMKNPSIGNCLISMYAKCGAVCRAREVFEKLSVQDVVAWSSMVKAYGMNHQGFLAIQNFQDMHARGIRPDEVTFVCLLNACAHASMVREGQEYFRVMRETHSVLPNVEHFSCMVDLLARSGHLIEAESFLENMCPSTVEIWSCLLSACKTHGEVELGFRCFQNLVEMKPQDASWYAIMSDIYTGAGMLQEAQGVEHLRKRVGAKKKPAIASIEVNKELHEFIIGEDRDEQRLTIEEIIGLQAKAQGYVPNLDLVLKPLSDSSKEVAVCHHVEKLAIAFGLLNTPQGETLRVTKNLRMCNDCHDTGKLVSQIEKREIILRDDCCLHHFKNGLCSCADLF